MHRATETLKLLCVLTAVLVLAITVLALATVLIGLEASVLFRIPW